MPCMYRAQTVDVPAGPVAHDGRGAGWPIACFAPASSLPARARCWNCRRCTPRSDNLRGGSCNLNFRLIVYGTVFPLSVVLLGVITLRLNAVAQGVRPRFRREIAIALKRLPTALLATLFAFAYPLAMLIVVPVLDAALPPEAQIFAAVPLLWPVALFVVALPAFWCDGLGPFAAIA